MLWIVMRGIYRSSHQLSVIIDVCPEIEEKNTLVNIPRILEIVLIPMVKSVLFIKKQPKEYYHYLIKR